MSDNWQKIWNKKQSKLDTINVENEEQIILELKRLSGYDFFGKKNTIAFEEFKKEYEYIKRNLGLSTQTGGGRV